MSRHNATIDWSQNGSDADYRAGHYSRAHSLGFGGGVSLPGSASPSIVRAPWSREDAADPEELLVASASSCHMLWFLDLASKAGFVVRAYHDEPQGRMGKMPGGSIGVTEIVLRPEVSFNGPAPSSELIAKLHHQAHACCNIAHSLKGQVLVQPVHYPVEA